MEEIYRTCEDCEYMHVSYYESDTGYEEWECELHGECLGEDCPYNFKYEREK